MMKRNLLIVLSLLVVFTLNASAQTSLDQTIAQLRIEIARREAIDREESTPEAQKIKNRVNLERARTALLNAVQNKIGALEKYLNTLGDSITPTEKEDARRTLRNLSANANTAAANTHSSVAASPSGSVQPVSEPAVASNGAAVQTTLKIINPADQSSSDSNEVEVLVLIDPVAANQTALKATVTNAGESIDSKDFTIEANERTGRVTLRLSPGANVIKIEDANDSDVSATISINVEDRKTAFTRAIVGVEQAAAASARPEQKLFLEFNLTAPLISNKKDRNPLYAPVWLWLNPRITSLPQQLTSSVAEFSTASNFIAPFNNGKVNEIVQGFEFLGGLEFRASPIFGAISSGFGKDTKVRFGVSLVLAGGMSTPFGSQQVAPQFFKVNDTVKEAFDVPDGKDFIAFVSADRNRFFRQYYGGLRIKSYFVKKDKNGNWDDLDNVFPGIIDLTFGQNESVTGGGLHGGIVRIDGIYPLPFIRGKYKGSIYAFGSALMKLSKPKLPPPVILQPPDSAPAFPAPNVFIQQVPSRDADHYRLGFGVDLIRLLKP